MKPLIILLLNILIYLACSGQLPEGGKTTGPLPFLEYGLGDDRLGGAKMTYLDTGIVLKVVDSVGTDYKVRLSASHFAWLSKQNFIWDTSVHFQPYYLTSSWKVWGDDKYDYVSVGLSEKLPYRSLQQVDPSRIVVDIFGVASNTNWITQLQTVKEIDRVWYEQAEDDVFRVFIQLKHPSHWGYSISYNNTALRIRVKRQPQKLKAKNLLVAVDAGHGGANSGASGINSKVNEKDYTLKIATRLKSYLKRKHYKVFMTRETDTDISMIDRTLMLRQNEPDFLVSIHLNSSSRDSISGVSTYYRYIGFRPLSQAILKRMLELNLNNFGNIGSFNFSLSGPTEYPNCLVEVAFLSNPDDEKKILQDHFQKDVAKKIGKGIRDWLRNTR